MLGTSTSSNPLSGFQFNIIGKQPALLSRISSKFDDSQDPVSSPVSSPLASPKMTAPSSTPPPPTVWLTQALADHQVEAQLGELRRTGPNSIALSDAARVAPQQNPCPRPSCIDKPESNAAIEQYKHSKSPTSVAISSHPSPSSSLSAEPFLVPFAASPPLSAISTKSPSSLSTGPTDTSHTDATSSASTDKSSSQDEEDVFVTFREALDRLKAGAAEYGRTQEETHRAMTKQQDEGTRLQARADALIERLESVSARVVCAEQRATRLENELKRGTDELRDARDKITRLQTEIACFEGENADLRGELVQVRQQAAEDGIRVKTMQEALACQAERDEEAARALAHSKAQERTLSDSLEATKRDLQTLRKDKKELQDELDAQKRDAAADMKALEEHLEMLRQNFAVEKATLEHQLEERKRAAEDRKLWVVEERSRLEAQIRAELAQSNKSQRSGDNEPQPLPRDSVQTVKDEQTHDSYHHPAGLPVSQHSNSDQHVPHTTTISLPALPSNPSPPQTIPAISQPSVPSLSSILNSSSSARSTTSGDGAAQKKSRGKLLHLSDDRSPQRSIPLQTEPLLAVKGEAEDEIKAKVEPVDESSTTVSSLPESRPHAWEPRREQSLDYGPIRETLRHSPSMMQVGPDSAALPDSSVSHVQERGSGSPAVPLEGHSPELMYPPGSPFDEPALLQRELPSVPLAQPSSGRSPVGLESPHIPNASEFIHSQAIGERRGPVTPPRECAPSGQGKKEVKRRRVEPDLPQRRQPAPAIDPNSPDLSIRPPTAHPTHPVRAVQSMQPPRPAQPTQSAQPPAQEPPSPRARRRAGSYVASRDRRPHPGEIYSPQDRNRHKRTRDDDVDARQPARRPRLTPPPQNGHDLHSPAVNQQTPQLISHVSPRTPPPQFSEGRPPHQQPSSSERHYVPQSPHASERVYIAHPNAPARGRGDHYSSHPEQLDLSDVPVSGYAPVPDVPTAPIRNTEPTYPQMAPPAGQRLLHGDSNAAVHAQHPTQGKHTAGPGTSRPNGSGGGGPPAPRRQTQRRSSPPPPAELPSSATSFQEPNESVSLLNRLRDPEPDREVASSSNSNSRSQGVASRGRGTGRGRGGRGRGQPGGRPQKSLEERIEKPQLLERIAQR